jgi:hypothetical protein
MATNISRRLVIDASVARSAGGENAVFPTSKHCRDFLKAVLDICHHVVLTPEIREEWHKHRSGYARRWLVSMFARKKAELSESVENKELRNKIDIAAKDEKSKTAMLKDVLLLEAALASDETVVSLDETVRGLFTELASNLGEIGNVIWVNPDLKEEEPLLWLENGAKPEKHRRLGAEK